MSYMNYGVENATDGRIDCNDQLRNVDEFVDGGNGGSRISQQSMDTLENLKKIDVLIDRMSGIILGPMPCDTEKLTEPQSIAHNIEINLDMTRAIVFRLEKLLSIL